MSDQCKHCTVRGDLRACLDTICNHHRNWISGQLFKQIVDLKEELADLESRTCSTCRWWEPLPSFWPLDWGLSSKCKRLTNRGMDETGEAQIEWCDADFGCNKWEERL